MLEKLLEFDRNLLLYINNFGIENHDGFWLFITNPISWLPLYLGILAILWYYFTPSKFYAVFLQIVLILLICALSTYFVKIGVGRLRPEFSQGFGGQLRVLSHPDSLSFFSGHAANSFALATYLVLILREKTRWLYLLYIWPMLFSYSRMYLGVHYPSDILTGLIVGVLIAFLVYKYVYLPKVSAG